MKKNNLDIRYVDPHSITPYENNAKIHDEDQIEQIKESIEEFGFNDPIAVDQDGVIIEGHGRLMAALELGLQEVPVFTITHLDDEKRRAYAIVHNKLTTNSEFDEDILQSELEKIHGLDMEFYGFDMNDNYFDADQEIVKQPKGIVVVRARTEEARRLRNWLLERGIAYTER